MASGQYIKEFWPDMNSPDLSAPAVPDWINGHKVLAFASVNDAANFEAILRDYAGGGLTFEIETSADNNTNNTKWEVSIERLQRSTQVLSSDSFASGQNSGDISVPGTAVTLKTISVNLSNSQIDGLLVNEPYRAKIKRLAAGSDVGGTTYLWGVSVKEQ